MIAWVRLGKSFRKLPDDICVTVQALNETDDYSVDVYETTSEYQRYTELYYSSPLQNSFMINF